MKKLFILLIIISSSCAYKIKEPILPISFIQSYPLDSTKIRFNGFYTNYCLDSLKQVNIDYKDANSIDMVVFSKKKKTNSDYHGVTKSNQPFTCEYYEDIVKWRKENKMEYLGDFTIKNDSIYAYVPIYLALTGHRFVQINFNYRGYLKNKDTITDWKVIKPYPKDITKVAIRMNPRLFKPQTLYFVKTDAVKCLQMD